MSRLAVAEPALDSRVLVTVFFAVALATVVLAVVLFVVKVLHRASMHRTAMRKAQYIAAIGEIVAHHHVPATDLSAWAEDPVFLEVLFDYLHIVTGEEHDALMDLIERLDLRRRLRRRLEDSGTDRGRLRAMTYLVEIADANSIELFVELLASPVEELRLHAVRGLAEIGDAECVPVILQQMERETPWMAARFADAITEFGEDAVPHLVRYLVVASVGPDRPTGTMRRLVRALGVIGDYAAEPYLLELLDDEEPLLRVAAASALESAGTPESVPALVRALTDEDWRVRARAATALGGLSDARAVEPLGAAMRDPVWWVRQNSAEALSNLPGGEARLRAALDDPDRFARDAAMQRLGLVDHANRTADGRRRPSVDGQASAPRGPGTQRERAAG